MLCPKCLRLRDEKDFFGKPWCYKCVYKEKLKKIPKICKVCSIEIELPRSKYCSKACLEVMNRRRTDAHWTRQITVLSAKWDNHEFYAVKTSTES